MSDGLRALQPGLMTTVQDLGRHGHQRQGIPVSGALDWVALRVANIVVGNDQGTAGLEMAVMGPVLEVEADDVKVALAGLGASLTIETGDGQSRDVPALQSTVVKRGDRIKVAGLGKTAVAYLAVAGGFDIAPFMGSLSTYARGGFGGFDGRALRQGDLLPLVEAEPATGLPVRLKGCDLEPARRVRVVLGPQDDYFTPEAIETLLGQPYRVTREADRMGLRLEGPPLVHAKGYNIVSDGIAPGSIQVPGSQQPIILLADRQTTGGYPKIATVISADLAALGRVLPGMEIRFEAISIEAAQAARHALEAQIAVFGQNLEIVRAEGLDLEALYGANLISGVTHALGGPDAGSGES